MFNKIKDEAKHLKQYFGSREVKESGHYNGLVWVEYVDGGRESMTEKEWAHVSSEPVNEDRDFVMKRVMPVAESILLTLKSSNVRLEDLGEVMTIVRDSIQRAVNQSKEVAYGQPAWTIRLDDIQKVLDDGKKEGKEPKFTGDTLRVVRGGMIDF